MPSHLDYLSEASSASSSETSNFQVDASSAFSSDASRFEVDENSDLAESKHQFYEHLKLSELDSSVTRDKITQENQAIARKILEKLLFSNIGNASFFISEARSLSTDFEISYNSRYFANLTKFLSDNSNNFNYSSQILREICECGLTKKHIGNLENFTKDFLTNIKEKSKRSSEKRTIENLIRSLSDLKNLGLLNKSHKDLLLTIHQNIAKSLKPNFSPEDLHAFLDFSLYCKEILEIKIETNHISTEINFVKTDPNISKIQKNIFTKLLSYFSKNAEGEWQYNINLECKTRTIGDYEIALEYEYGEIYGTKIRSSDIAIIDTRTGNVVAIIEVDGKKHFVDVDNKEEESGKTKIRNAILEKKFGKENVIIISYHDFKKFENQEEANEYFDKIQKLKSTKEDLANYEFEENEEEQEEEREEEQGAREDMQNQERQRNQVSESSDYSANSAATANVNLSDDSDLESSLSKSPAENSLMQTSAKKSKKKSGPLSNLQLSESQLLQLLTLQQKLNPEYEKAKQDFSNKLSNLVSLPVIDLDDLEDLIKNFIKDQNVKKINLEERKLGKNFSSLIEKNFTAFLLLFHYCKREISTKTLNIVIPNLTDDKKLIINKLLNPKEHTQSRAKRAIKKSLMLEQSESQEADDKDDLLNYIKNYNSYEWKKDLLTAIKEDDRFKILFILSDPEKLRYLSNEAENINGHKITIIDQKKANALTKIANDTRNAMSKSADAFMLLSGAQTKLPEQTKSTILQIIDLICLYGKAEILKDLYNIFDSPEGNIIKEMLHNYPNYLKQAIRRDDVALVKKLIECGCDIDGTTKCSIIIEDNNEKKEISIKLAALEFAIYNNKKESVRFLIKNGAKIDDLEIPGKKPTLFYVRESDSEYEGTDFELIKMIIDAGADPSLEIEGCNFSCFYQLIKNGNNEAISYILEKYKNDEKKIKRINSKKL